jgi:DNA topoisomerase IB
MPKKQRPVSPVITTLPVVAAQQAQLRYVSDLAPGIGRRRAGKHFSYRDDAGRRVSDPATLDRIRKLAIPPAWTDVWRPVGMRGPASNIAITRAGAKFATKRNITG